MSELQQSGEGAAPAAIQSVDERADALFGFDEATEGAGPEQDGSGEPVAAAPAAVEPDEAAKARAARRQAYEQVKAKERERVDAATAMRERDELRAKLAAAEEKTKAYSTYIDPKQLTKEQFFALAEKNPELTPQELGEWLRERMANPELAAAKAARSAVDPELETLRQQNAELAKKVEAIEAKAAEERQAIADHQATSEFLNFTQANAAQAPRSAAFLTEFGVDEYLKVAVRAAAEVPDHVSDRHQLILDEIEEQLTQLARIYSASPQRPQATPPSPNLAPAKAPMNVSNTLAQQRSSVVNERADFARLSVEERASHIFDT